MLPAGASLAAVRGGGAGPGAAAAAADAGEDAALLLDEPVPNPHPERLQIASQRGVYTDCSINMAALSLFASTNAVAAMPCRV